MTLRYLWQICGLFGLLSHTADGAPRLWLSIDRSRALVKPGDLVPLAVTAGNSGDTDLLGVTVQSLLPEGLDAFLAGTAEASCSNLLNNCYPGVQISWALGTIRAGTSRTVLLPAQIQRSARDGIIQFSANANSQNGQTASSAAEVRVQATAPLSLSLTADRGTIEPGGLITYSLLLVNPSPAAGGSGTIEAEVPDGTEFVSASNAGAQSGNVVRWLTPAVPAGRSIRRSLVVRVKSVPDGTLLRGRATVVGTAAAVPYSSIPTIVRSAPGVHLFLVPSVDPARSGEVLTYRLTATNSGPTDAANIVIRGIVPQYVSTFWSVYSGVSCSNLLSNCYPGVAVSWNTAVLRAGGATSLVIPAQIAASRVDSPDGGVISLVARLSHSNEYGELLWIDTPIDSQNPIALAVEAEPASVRAGSSGTVTIALSNRTTTTLEGGRISVDIPAEMTALTVSETGKVSNRSLVWDTGSIGPGDAIYVHFQARVTLPTAANALAITAAAELNGAIVARAPTLLPVESRAGVRTTAQLEPSLTRPGEMVPFAITFSNETTSDLQDFQARAPVPERSEAFLGFAADGVCYNLRDRCVSGELVRWNIGTLRAGTSRTVMMPVQISAGRESAPDGSLVQAAVIADSISGSAPANTRVLTVNSNPAASLTIEEDRTLSTATSIAYTVRIVGARAIDAARLQVLLPQGARAGNVTQGGSERNGYLEWPEFPLRAGEVARRSFTVEIGSVMDPTTSLHFLAIATVREGQRKSQFRASQVKIIREANGIRLSPTAQPGAVKAGERATVDVLIRNTSTRALSAVELRSIVPSYVETFPGSAAGASCSNALNNCYAGVAISWSVGTLAAGGGRTISVPVSVSAQTPIGRVIPWVFSVVSSEGASDLAQCNLLVAISGDVTGPSVPAISPAGIVSVADYQPGPAAPGSILAIFGSALSRSAAAAQSFPLPTSIEGTSVRIGGTPAPMLFVSPTQANVQVPFEVTASTTVSVSSSDGTSADAPLLITSAAPHIFVASGGRAAIVNEDGSLNDPMHPARTGSIVTVYLTGQGALVPAVATGAAAPLAPLSRAAGVTSATVGGVPAVISFSGGTPGFAGLGQINLQIPAELDSGEQQLSVSVNGVNSRGVGLHIKRP